MKEMNNEFNKICKNEYGIAYAFNQKDDDKNIIQCNKNQIKIRCIYKLDNVIENYSNNGLEMNNNIGTSTNIYNYITLFLLIIFILILLISFV